MKKFLLICLIGAIFFQDDCSKVTALSQNSKTLETATLNIEPNAKTFSSITKIPTPASSGTVTNKVTVSLKFRNDFTTKKHEKELRMIHKLIIKHSKTPNFFRLLIRYGKRRKSFL